MSATPLKLKELTRELTTAVGDLRIRFNAGKIDWETFDRLSNVLEDTYVIKIISLLAPTTEIEGA